MQLAVCANAAGISIHALLAESDGAGSRVCTTCFNFYPRSPCGERRQCSMYFRLRSRFLSTLSLRRATQFFSYSKMRYQFLSTLSLRRATTITGIIYSDRKISIHALLAESDRPTAQLAVLPPKFLSTLSLRRATDTAPVTGGGVTISIHALLAESDVRNIYAVHWFSTFLSTLSLRRATRAFCWALPSKLFLSTLSLRRATPRRKRLFHRCAISIHALLAESDTWYNAQKDKQKYFYPRSPCGERPADRCGASCRFLFLSTLSLRRATCNMHSLRYCCTNFYPRSPCGERPINALLFLLALNISIHALLAESDGTGADRGWPVPHFYPRSPCGERHVFIVGVAAGVRFLSTLSLRRATLAGQKLVKADTGISIHALLAESDELLAERFGNTLISIHALLAESDGRVKSL